MDYGTQASIISILAHEQIIAERTWYSSANVSLSDNTDVKPHARDVQKDSFTKKNVVGSH
jgi:hypothetical protein